MTLPCVRAGSELDAGEGSVVLDVDSKPHQDKNNCLEMSPSLQVLLSPATIHVAINSSVLYFAIYLSTAIAATNAAINPEKNDTGSMLISGFKAVHSLFQG